MRAERRTMRWSLLLVLSTFAGGFLLSLVGKATLLARAIGEAMNLTAAWVVVLPLWAIPFTVGEVRRSRRPA